MDADQELLAVFRAEVDEQIDDLCGRLERAPGSWRIGKLFQIAHNIKGAARLVGVDSVRDTAHPLEDLFAFVRDGARLSDEIVELARAGGRLLDACFRSLDSGEVPDLTGFRSTVAEMLQKNPEDVGSPSDDPTPDGSAEESGPTADMSESASTAEAPIPAGDQASTIRVATHKLETLTETASDFVGLVLRAEGHTATAKELTSQIAFLFDRNPTLAHDPGAERVGEILRDLVVALSDHEASALLLSEEMQASIRSLRMVRFAGLRSMLNRAVREACANLGRRAELKFIGAETEIDRAVLEGLRDPLVHILRNAIAHGVESPDERLARGKDPAGRIDLETRVVGSSVEVAVRDDGSGIDHERVLRRAVESNLLDPENDDLSPAEILQVLFQPGFSTADEVSEIAGRGVGLDVVQSHLMQLGGTAAIASTPGQGTCVTMQVPLTRLTTQGIVVTVGGQNFVCPVSDVERSLQVERRDVILVKGRESIEIDGDFVRLAPLGSILGITTEEQETQPALVIADGPRRRAFLVDRVVGHRQFIAQPLNWNLKGMPGVSGSAVLDGSDVVLVLDSRQLLGTAKSAGSGWSKRGERRRYRILVVDDSVTSRTLETNILRGAGYDVSAAVDGQEALDKLGEGDYDLVLSDVEMPKLNGFELTNSIRSDARFDQIPVILVTSLGTEDDRQKGADAGADAYIVKGDFDQDELLCTVARLL